MFCDSCSSWIKLNISMINLLVQCTGADFILKYCLTNTGIPIMEIRGTYDCLISTKGFPMLIRWHLYIQSEVPCLSMSSALIHHDQMKILLRLMEPNSQLCGMSHLSLWSVPGIRACVWAAMHCLPLLPLSMLNWFNEDKYILTFYHTLLPS